MSIGDELQRPKEKRPWGWNWLLWWQIDPVDLDEQVRLYDTIGFRGSMRGISVLLLAFSCVVTTVVVYFHAMGADAYAYIDIGIFVVLALFIYLGHRWAMIGAMIIWTLEKALIIAGSPILAIPQIIWWALYMHAFYFALRVELRRRALARAAAG